MTGKVGRTDSAVVRPPVIWGFGVSIRLFRMYVKLPIVLLALIEASLLVFAAYFAASLHFDGRATGAATTYGNLLPTALLFAFLGTISLFAVGLYSTRQRTTAAGILVRIVAAVSVAVALSAFVYYFVPAVAVDRHQHLDVAGVAAFGHLEERRLDDAFLAGAVDGHRFFAVFQVDRILQEIVVGQPGRRSIERDEEGCQRWNDHDRRHP